MENAKITDFFSDPNPNIMQKQHDNKYKYGNSTGA